MHAFHNDRLWKMESQFTQIDDKYKTTVQQGVSDDADATPDSTDPSQTEQTIQPDSTKEQEADKKGKNKERENRYKGSKVKRQYNRPGG